MKALLVVLCLVSGLTYAQGVPVVKAPVVSTTGQITVTAETAIPTGYDWVYATVFDFANCTAGGSAAQSLTAGTYMLTVLTEPVTICYAATCAAGGRTLPANSIVTIKVAATTSVSCRSAGSTGDLEYTKLQ